MRWLCCEIFTSQQVFDMWIDTCWEQGKGNVSLPKAEITLLWSVLVGVTINEEKQTPFMFKGRPNEGTARNFGRIVVSMHFVYQEKALVVCKAYKHWFDEVWAPFTLEGKQEDTLFDGWTICSFNGQLLQSDVNLNGLTKINVSKPNSRIPTTDIIGHRKYPGEIQTSAVGLRPKSDMYSTEEGLKTLPDRRWTLL